MGIADQMFDDLKQAMRDRDAVRVAALRFMRSEIQKTEKDRQRPLEDPEVVDNLARQSRRLKESIVEFTKAGRRRSRGPRRPPNSNSFSRTCRGNSTPKP